jgi:hypothetical protein
MLLKKVRSKNNKKMHKYSKFAFSVGFQLGLKHLSPLIYIHTALTGARFDFVQIYQFNIANVGAQNLCCVGLT